MVATKYVRFFFLHIPHFVVYAEKDPTYINDLVNSPANNAKV